ncbi:DNA translocase FtsK 4TM domain-containing protein [Candidatus Profftia tarda]|uniref:DNA translocase FtsK 4TM domain-containing protein n=1 Tax=Candidatus Profftia tarda TaxID=1177216 RepID=UPI001C1FC8D0|nr:DNA translocase FtsK 4TM domain-containing protein [Candidatus Profftia tarda]
MLFFIYLMISLFSFNPSDPTWLQTGGSASIKNIGGKMGAWIADTIFFFFGIIGYIIPLSMLALHCLIFSKDYKISSIHYFNISVKIIGMLLVILTSCSLASLNCHDVYSPSLGGVIGILFNKYLNTTIGNNNVIMFLLLFVMWFIGIRFFTGWSWLSIVEKFGIFLRILITCISHYFIYTWKIITYFSRR